MTEDELVDKLHAINKQYANDYEVAHGEADRALLDFIHSRRVSRAFFELTRYYA